MTIVSPQPALAPPPHRRITRQQFHALYENGLLDFAHHHELIEGEIVDKMGQKEPHIGVLLLWSAALGQVFGVAFVRAQMPIVIDNESEPEPDLSVATRPVATYLASGETTPAADVRLIIEISVNTLAIDLGAKANLYSRGGIPDYWVSDVVGRRLIVHRDPTPAGYASITTFTDGDTVAPLAAPASSFRVADFLP